MDKNKKEDYINGIDTDERLYAPDPNSEEMGIIEHFDRYKFALDLINDKDVVMDAACGSGYGTKILSDKANKVIGLEVDEYTVKYANFHYKEKNIIFKKADLNKKIHLEDNCVDVIVSFETLEHISNQENALLEFKRILKPNGKLIISTPDNNIISGGLKSDNPFHVKELNRDQFVSLLKKYFTISDFYGQGIKKKLPIWKEFLKKFRGVTFLRKLKQCLTKKLSLEKIVHSYLDAEDYTKITEIPMNGDNLYYVLIATCLNEKK